jgi:hypothetical protein
VRRFPIAVTVTVASVVAKIAVDVWPVDVMGGTGSVCRHVRNLSEN